MTIPDGHVGTSAFDSDRFFNSTAGGLGWTLAELDDGRVIVSWLLENGPAEQAGIELGAEIVTFNKQPIADYLDTVFAWTGPFSTSHNLRLGQLGFASRVPLEMEVQLTYKNPGQSDVSTTTVTPSTERDSLFRALVDDSLTGDELPVEYETLDSGYLYVQIFSFLDNAVLTIQLWERMIETARNNNAPGIIIDMRQNGGGTGFLADQMAAYFFNEALNLGNTGHYDEETGEFEFDPNLVERFRLPPTNQRYNGPIAVLVGPNCASACEFFSYDMTRQDRAAIIGHYPTAGLGGSIEQFFMPDGHVVQFTGGRAVDEIGNIHIEGIGIVPTVDVPITAESVLGDDDVLIEAAVDYLNRR